MASLFDNLVPFDEPQEIPSELDNLDTPFFDEEESDDPNEELEKLSENSDDRVLAIYDYLTESNIIPKKDEFKGSPEELEELLETLPETMFSNVLQEVHEDGQSLLDYAFKLGKNATLENLKKFFNSYVETTSYDLDNEEQAYDYLKEKFSQTKVFKSEDKLIRYLEDLQDDGELITTAKEKYDEEKAELTARRDAELLEAKKLQEQEKENIKQFYSNIHTTVESLKWDNSRKSEVLKNMEPNEVVRKNELISKSPMALIQLADIYSRFDEKTGQFDMTDYEMKLESAKTNEKKDKIIKTKLESSLSRIKGNPSQTSETPGSFFSQFNKTN